MSAGPLIGGEFEPGDDAPRAVSKNYFYEVCPESERTTIYTHEVNNETIRFSNDIGAAYMFDRWVEKLNSVESRCVQTTLESYGLFEMW